MENGYNYVKETVHKKALKKGINVEILALHGWVSFSFLLFKNFLLFPVLQGKTILFPLTSWAV